MRKTLVNKDTPRLLLEMDVDVFVDIKFSNLGIPFAYGLCLGQNQKERAACGLKDGLFFARQSARSDRGDTAHIDNLRQISELPEINGTTSLRKALRDDLRSAYKAATWKIFLWGNRMTLIFLQEMLRKEKGSHGDVRAIEGLFPDEPGYGPLLKAAAREADIQGLPHNPLATSRAMAVLKYRYETLQRDAA